jgi:acetyl-CoA/propionyl-CoA carboxylase biotin carboxyl carrier protein
VTDEISPSEFARRLGASTRTVQRWIASGRLPARRVGGRWRVASDAFDASAEATRPERPIRTLFVANRGEIANRIARTCRRLAIGVVVPATEGAGALDLLDVAAVVAAAVEAGADAVHPGFGFLAENADFAEAVAATGMRWIGPPPGAIRAMGDKAAARRLAASLGINVVPGYDGDDQSDTVLGREATAIGFPLLVKPAAGGGGKGMRTVRDPATLGDAIASARREARGAFGDDRLILERFVEGPRHVEIQVLFDGHGNGVHLGERDCSIQRRHQKILEETPSPGVDDTFRRALGDAAVRLASAVGYVSAGTCEFLVDDRGRWFFLEMNTRLQVEHPVTELVTGRDLVADQIRIAAGDLLGFEQEDVRPSGHAVEVRLYAEDAEDGFLPATGRVVALAWPTGEGIRIDAGIEVGTTVGGRFDPMLAKIVAHGRDRAEALDRLTQALDETVVLGLVTNLRFLRWLVRQPAVLDGQARIDTLERIWPPDDWAERAAIPDEAWAVAAAAFTKSASEAPWSGGWRLNGAPRIRLQAEGAERTVTPEAGAMAHVAADDAVHVDVAGRNVSFRVAAAPDVDRAARAATAQAHGGGPAELLAPMPGIVLAVHAAVGDEVATGDPIVTVEAMKMEHVVAAPAGGHLAELNVAAGDQVVRGQVIGSVTV